MRTVHVLIFLLFTHFSHSQLIETFSDGNITQSPIWQGDISNFIVNSSFALQSQGPSGNGQIQLHTPLDKLIATEWNILVRMDFEPSTSNYSKIYLVSDQPDLKGNLNGYYLKVGGESGTSDKIELYKQSGIFSEKIITGTAGNAGKSINTIRIKVVRDFSGNWYLYSDTNGSYNFILEGMGFDNTFTINSYFGILCIHTSTRKDQFFFDDINICPAPFFLSSAEAISKKELKLSFSKPIEKTTSENSTHYLLKSIGHPQQAIQVSPNEVYLTFSQSISKGWYDLEYNSILSADSSSLSDSIFTFIFDPPLNFADILITEVYPDPTPSNGMPEEEFVEIFNNTTDTIDLTDFHLSDPTVEGKLFSGILPPESYIILCPTSAISAFQNFGSAIAVSPWPSLNNNSETISLTDKKNRKLFELIYSEDWYGAEEKKQGGWSLEMINFKDYCSSSNWKASNATEGATPGIENSVYSSQADTLPPVLKSFDFEDSVHLVLSWDEELDTLSTPECSCGDIKVNTEYTSPTSLKLKFASIPEENCNLTIFNLMDCKGNMIANFTYPLHWPEKEESHDVLVNEILFNPRPGGTDFVEIFNRSSKAIDLRNWTISSLKNGDSISCQPFLSSYLLLPNSFMAFTPSRSLLESHYYIPYPENIHEVANLPNFNDDFGTVLLLNSKGQLIDRFDYQEKFHLETLNEKEGVSLERISYWGPDNTPSNWHSSSASSGWATPGYENSQHIETRNEGNFRIDPKIITPDLDGEKDFALFHYRFDSPGYVCAINVFDLGGRKIAALAQNYPAGIEGFFEWDGVSLSGELAAPGLYILTMEAFNSNGKTIGWKGTLIIAAE